MEAKDYGKFTADRVCRMLAIKPKTLRYYDKIGLLKVVDSVSVDWFDAVEVYEFIQTYCRKKWDGKPLVDWRSLSEQCTTNQSRLISQMRLFNLVLEPDVVLPRHYGMNRKRYNQSTVDAFTKQFTAAKERHTAEQERGS